MTDTAKVDRPTHCPTCGVKLPDIPVSLCAYCASPVQIGTKQHGGDESPNAGRIAKIAQHKSYEDTLAYQPPEAPAYLSGIRKVWHGRNLIVFGAIIGGLGMYLSGWSHPLFVLGVLGLATGAWMLFQGMQRKAGAIAEALTTRAGMIVDRRSETSIRSWNGETVYFFTIEFEGGAVGEYRFDGRGASEDPYPSGMTGVAFLRGAQLLEFKQIRV